MLSRKTQHMCWREFDGHLRSVPRSTTNGQFAIYYRRCSVKPFSTAVSGPPEAEVVTPRPSRQIRPDEPVTLRSRKSRAITSLENAIRLRAIIGCRSRRSCSRLVSYGA